MTLATVDAENSSADAVAVVMQDGSTALVFSSGRAVTYWFLSKKNGLQRRFT